MSIAAPAIEPAARAGMPERALVTGGTSATGSAVVEALAQAGAVVVFTGRNTERAALLTERTGAQFLEVDARDPQAVRASASTAIAMLGGLDALVLATGVLHTGPLMATSDTEWDELVSTNLKASFAWATACLSALRTTGGSVVTVASAAALWPDIGASAYAVTKRALLSLTEMLAAEAAPQVRVNAVCPGDGAPMASVTLGSGLAAEIPTPPMGRFAHASDVADAVMFFLSGSSAFCTGTNLRVDGGLRGAHR